MGRFAHQRLWWTAGAGEQNQRDEGLVGFFKPRKYGVDDLPSVNRRQTGLQKEVRTEGKFIVFSGSHISQKIIMPFTRTCSKQKLKRHPWFLVSKCTLSFEELKIFLAKETETYLASLSCFWRAKRLFRKKKENQVKYKAWHSCVRWRFWVYQTCHILSGISIKKQ